MKKFVLGFLFALFLMGGVLAINDASYNLTESPYPLYVNCSLMDFKSPILDLDGTTYVPLREFCERNQAYIDFKKNLHLSSNYIKVSFPFVQNEILKVAVPNKVSFFEESYEKEIFSDKKDLRPIKISSAEEAVKFAAAQIAYSGDDSIYDTRIFDVLYFEKYDAWMIMFNNPYQDDNMECMPSSEWTVNVIINSDGELLDYFYDFPKSVPITEEGNNYLKKFMQN